MGGAIDGPAESAGDGLADGIAMQLVGVVDRNPVMMVTGYGEDVDFNSASSGRKCAVATSPAADKELAMVSLISIQRVVV